jgi:hypothetical protein
MFEFDACIRGCDVPVGLSASGIAIEPPGGDFLDESWFAGNATVEALRRHDGEYGKLLQNSCN